MGIERTQIDNILGDGIGRMQLMSVGGDDLLVANAARASFDKEVTEFGPAERRILRFLLRSDHPPHWAPFGHPTLTVRIHAPISVQRQWEKHKIGVVNSSESTRYVTMKPEFYIPNVFRVQSKDRKQGSSGSMDPVDTKAHQRKMQSRYNTAHADYLVAIQDGMAVEQARDLLPMATYTTWVSTLTLYAAFNLIHLRTHDGAQWEIGQYAEALRTLVQQDFPESYEAWLNRNAV